MALAQIKEIQTRRLCGRSAELGEFLLRQLRAAIPSMRYRFEIRGLGLMAGMELRRHDGSPATAEVFTAVKALLRRGFIFLPEGEHGNVISLTPPLTITRAQLAKAVAALAEVLATDGRR